MAAARAALPDHVRVVPLPQDDAWFRDTGPTVSAAAAGAAFCHAARRRLQLRLLALPCWLPTLAPRLPSPRQFVVREEGGGRRSVAGVDWRFNAWGGVEGGLYASWQRDDAVAASILQARQVPALRGAWDAASGSQARC